MKDLHTQFRNAVMHFMKPKQNTWFKAGSESIFHLVVTLFIYFFLMDISYSENRQWRALRKPFPLGLHSSSPVQICTFLTQPDFFIQTKTVNII